jgi:predicted nucleotidyltransferase component of viral defense system
MPETRANLGASVRARLLRIAQASGQTYELVLTRYALERLLYRLSISPHAERFVLKGAMLLMTWFEDPHRGTRDLDLLGFGDPDPDAMLAVFREIVAIEAGDGVAYAREALRIERIREDLAYGGLRLRGVATIAGARLALTVDIGFGDAIDPGLEEIEYPALLGMPAPRLRAYARETVIAEKFEAMVVLGRANSRMKDFYDIWMLSRAGGFADDRLARAIAAIFARRGTAIPIEPPDALTPAFAVDEPKRQQWRAFVSNVAMGPGELSRVVADLAAFLVRHARAACELDRRPQA